MSRIIVKGLPKYLTEDKLKAHFAQKGEITDVKLRKNRQGESRRFAFLGYKNATDAEDAVKYFNGSFIDTAKIEVDLAKSFVDPEVPKSFREKRREAYQRVKERDERIRMREEEEREYKKQKRDGSLKSKIDEEIESNTKLQEFIEATKPSTQAKSWSNGVVLNSGGAPSNSLLDHALALKDGTSVTDNKFSNNIADEIFKVQENESDDEYNDFNGKNDEGANNDDNEQMISLTDLPSTTTDRDAAESNNEDDDKTTDAAVSDLDWLKQRRIRVKESGEILPGGAKQSQASTSLEVDTEPLQEEQENYQVQEQEPEEPEVSLEEQHISKIKETGRLFLRNISYSATEDDFRALFSKYGSLEEVHIAIDTRTAKSKGFCYIQFTNSENAVNAYIELDKQIFQGRLLHILPGEGKKDHKLDEFDLKNLPLKKQRELKKKNDASKSQFSWNSLYLNTDAVMENIASNLGVDKRELFDPENSNSGVKQALAEAHVIGDVRKFFESKGIDLTKFQGKERDDSVLLVKNIPFDTTEAELLELFQPFGELKRFLMPSSGTIAIVQFRDAPTGRSAFTKLAYRRFKKSILYLEKGPKDLFTREPSNDDKVDKIEVKENIKEIKDNSINVNNEDIEVFEGATVSIFVKNLNFTTTAQVLQSVFEKLDGYVAATIKTKPDPKDSTKKMSMGFGFAEFKSKDQAITAISVVDGTVLEGHRLQLKLSHRQNVVGSDKPKDSKSKASGKIIVKNLPFEATRKDVFELFNSFGQLKSVRVPKKFDKSARGFAFVEFLLPKEAENAMDQLQGVHLLGRRLVMQYAEQSSDDVEEEIEKLTRKAKKQVATRELGAIRATGKRKLDLDDDEDLDHIDNV
jgi:multiple RNA-binding domain-containing protein 1